MPHVGMYLLRRLTQKTYFHLGVGRRTGSVSRRGDQLASLSSLSSTAGSTGGRAGDRPGGQVSGRRGVEGRDRT